MGDVPYAGSELTQLLQGSIGNSSETILIATISPQADQAEQTLTTMKFADSAREVIIQPSKNTVLAYDMAPKLHRESQQLQELVQAKS